MGVIAHIANVIVSIFASCNTRVLLLECTTWFLQTEDWNHMTIPKLRETLLFESGMLLSSQIGISLIKRRTFVVGFSPARGTPHPSDMESMEEAQ